MEIKDSGVRREFDTGAVRDIQEGKGRCDLLPLKVVADLLCIQNVLLPINKYMETGNWIYLVEMLSNKHIVNSIFTDKYTMILEVSKQFEQGAKKYGEYNWQKGIPTNCYVDSAVRHYLKFLRGDKDEPHDRAFVWNIVCCIWTCVNKPELNVYNKGDKIIKDNIPNSGICLEVKNIKDGIITYVDNIPQDEFVQKASDCSYFIPNIDIKSKSCKICRFFTGVGCGVTTDKCLNSNKENKNDKD